jgi:hypothetical protein
MKRLSLYAFMYSLMEEELGKLFFTDKRGNTLFFPMGRQKSGYYLNDLETKHKIIKFISSMTGIYFLVGAVALALFFKFWLFYIILFFFSLSWFLMYRLYLYDITKSLPIVPEGYAGSIFENSAADDSELDEDEEEPEMDYEVPIRPNKRIQPVKYDPYLKIKRLYYRITAGRLALLSGSIGFAIYLIHPYTFRVQSQNYLQTFWVCLFFGLSGFLLTTSAEISEPGIKWFLRWRLWFILIMVGCWGGALYALIKWIVLVALNSIVNVLLR